MVSKSFNLKKAIERLDKRQVGRSISLLREQILETERSFPKKILPRRPWKNVVVAAMGGSGLGIDVLRYVYEPHLSVPIQIVNGYHLPGYVNNDTLVICVTYSGTTEEIISCFKEARQKKAGLVAISAGGTLAQLALQTKTPHFVFTPNNNPSQQPRIGTGYTMTSFYLLMREQGLLKKGAPDFIVAAQRMKSLSGPALTLAQKIKGRSVFIIGSEHLRGNAHVMANQINECTKAFAAPFFIPELNHHLLEGLDNIYKTRNAWTAIFLESRNYDSRNARRFAITEDVFKKQGISVHRVAFSGAPADEALAVMSFGAWLSYYGALLLGIDPQVIPWVDYFKKKLA